MRYPLRRERTRSGPTRARAAAPSRQKEHSAGSLGRGDELSAAFTSEQHSVAAARRAVYGRRKLPTRGKLPIREVVVTILKNSAWPWLMLAALLVVVGLVVVDGAAGSIILACGFIALFGAGIKLISRNDPTPPEERRVPAGHSGI